MATENLRRQQRELLALADQLEVQLDALKLMGNARSAFAVVNAMTGVLRLHLATEGGMVYPRLQRHPELAARVIAIRHLQDTDAMKETFLAFAGRWKSADAIQARPIFFIREAREVLLTLRRRLTRKEQELYPLVDRLPEKRAS